MAFQTSGFQRNAFQLKTGGSAPVPPVVTTGGFDDYHYKKYRKYLDKLSKITSEERKYSKEYVEAAQELQDLPVETPEINKLTKGPELKGTLRLTPQIDYAALGSELELLKAYLDMMGVYRSKILEADDEAAFLILLQ